MVRGRGKGKKQTLIASHEDTASGEEEKIPSYRRRGRPQKPLKDDIEERAEKMGEDGEDAKDSITTKDTKNQTAIVNGRKRKSSAHVKENLDTAKEETGVGTKLSTDDSTKTVGFRQNGRKRKNKPRRAAEVGFECK
ncbi:uncharacterized protein LOC120013416 [Tripterygium wilfordii]|uniref:uncharacterized protein LOC120013416 n=1 Tax=Tripterygium wilfordii TaxID=458696 RepID=UPI0018F803BD|nr:uncharacterized protein LOC120013416 [Tripterygium wilfordii]